MYKLCFYVPQTHVDSVKQAGFDKGAGKIGDYDCCAWQTLGEGQFRPLKNAQPYLGTVENLEKVPEYKVEMVCDDESIKAVIKALKESHPY